MMSATPQSASLTAPLTRGANRKAASVVAHRYGRLKKVYVAVVIIPQRDKKRNKRRIA